MRILVVEDDALLAAGLRYNLERAGYEVAYAPDAEAARAELAAGPDLVLLDLMLPGTHGFDLLRRLREGSRDLPVIVLSAQDGEGDRIRGLDIGADDFVGKPFAMGELLARIRARLRAAPADAFPLGDGVVRLDALCYECADRREPLTPTEVEVLRVLGAARGRPVSREELLRRVWGVSGSATRTLDTHITRLRRKLEPDPAHPRHLLTVHGHGYRLSASE